MRVTVQVKRNTDGSSEDSFYGYNPHTDVETLTDSSGDTRATYGYTASGQNDDSSFTGVDKPDPQDPTEEPYNFYRFNAKRFDPASGTYDMGFRDYDPGLNRYLTRDLYNGALADLDLATDPFTSNRYAFAGGNPITGIELDGHVATTLKQLEYINGPYTPDADTQKLLNANSQPPAGPAPSPAPKKSSGWRAVGNALAGAGRGLVGLFEAATPLAQANVSLNNPAAAKVTQRVPVLRDVAGWVAEHQASGAYDQAAKTLGADPSSGAYKGGDIAATVIGAVVTGAIGGGARAAATATEKAATRIEAGDEAFHYTFGRALASVEKQGLRSGSYATPNGTLSPLQAQIDLALPPNRGLPDALVRIDLAGLRKAGYEIPQVRQVGRSFGMPGGGYEIQFPYSIPSQFIKVISP